MRLPDIDTVRCLSCAVLLAPAFGIPSESPDVSLLLAWLTRNAAAPMGLLLLLPGDAPPSVLAHLAHLLQRLLKVREHQWQSTAVVTLSTSH